MFFRFSILVTIVFLVIPSVFLLINCGEETPQTPVPPVETADVTPPAAVTGMYPGNTTSISVPLVWNAPGDDGDKGQADHYDIRYSLAAITEENWDQATEIDNEPDPKPAPGLETVVVKGLRDNTRYHFALKTYDEAGNVSGLSNDVSAKTQFEYQEPAAINDLSAHAVSLNEYLLTWTAVGDDGTLPGTASKYDIRYSTREITGANFASATGVVNEPDPRPQGEQDSCLVFIPDPEPGKSYYFAMKTADEVPNWSPLSRVVMAMAIDQTLLVFPYDITLGQDKDLLIMFRSVNPYYLYKLTVMRWAWNEYPYNEYKVIKHFTPAKYPVGVYSFIWDLRDDLGILVPLSYAQLWVRLYRGVTPIDSVNVRLYDHE
jgi:hypothetical protein